MSEEKILLSEFTTADTEEENITEANLELSFIKNNEAHEELNIDTQKTQSEVDARSQLNLEGATQGTGVFGTKNINFGFNTGYTESNGPKFGQEVMQKIEAAKNSGWSTRLKNLGDGKKFSLIALIAIIAFIGINYFTTNKTEEASLINLVTQEENLAISKNTITLPEAEVATTTNTIPIISDGKLIETASAGEGVTHLARRTVDKYLQAYGKTLTAEQKIYAEDYLKDIQGSSQLNVGQEVGFNNTNVETAVNQALALEEWQINNLKQYVN